VGATGHICQRHNQKGQHVLQIVAMSAASKERVKQRERERECEKDESVALTKMSTLGGSICKHEWEGVRMSEVE